MWWSLCSKCHFFLHPPSHPASGHQGQEGLSPEKTPRRTQAGVKRLVLSCASGGNEPQEAPQTGSAAGGGGDSPSQGELVSRMQPRAWRETGSSLGMFEPMSAYLLWPHRGPETGQAWTQTGHEDPECSGPGAPWGVVLVWEPRPGLSGQIRSRNRSYHLTLKHRPVPLRRLNLANGGSVPGFWGMWCQEKKSGCSGALPVQTAGPHCRASPSWPGQE